MAQTLNPYTPPLVWTELTAVAGYTGLANVNAVIEGQSVFPTRISFSATAPSDNNAGASVGFEDARSGNAAKIWVRGTNALSLILPVIGD